MSEIRTLTEAEGRKVATADERFVLRNGDTFIACEWRGDDAWPLGSTTDDYERAEEEARRAR